MKTAKSKEPTQTTVPVRLTKSQFDAVQRIAAASEQPVEVVIRVMLAMHVCSSSGK